MRKECIVIDGEPVGQGRPRMNRKGWLYKPEKDRIYEQKVKKQWNRREKFSGPVYVKIEAYLQIPQRCKTSRPTKKPDIDNIAKIIMDSLNKAAWDDDKQVVRLTVNKSWSNEPRVEVTITEVVE